MQKQILFLRSRSILSDASILSDKTVLFDKSLFSDGKLSVSVHRKQRADIF